MRKFLLLATFFVTIPFVFLFTLLFALYASYHHKGYLATGQKQTVAYAALPTSENVFQQEIVSEEARVEKIRQFFAKYKSPLEPHAQLVVDLADQYELDYRLLPAIAMQESNLCRRIPEDSHNCWGFGIYGGKITRFESYEQAIETVTKTLATKYRKKGLVSTEEIMSMYTPSSNGSWAQGVNHFMDLL